jgi:arylsulfatase
MTELDQAEPFVFSADETLDIGFQSGSCVTTEYRSNRLSGEVNWVQIGVGEDANRRVCCCSAQLGEQC